MTPDGDLSPIAFWTLFAFCLALCAGLGWGAGTIRDWLEGRNR